MVRRDYILRMIDDFVQFLTRLKSLRLGQKWNELSEAVDSEFKKLVGADREAITRLSETELLAMAIQGEPTLAVREKVLMLVSLLHEAGDAAAAQEQYADARAIYLKGLHLLLETLATGDPYDFPDFVPKVEQFVAALAEAPLPMRTMAMLMRHYETAGDFGKAEDMLYAMVEEEHWNPAVVRFGISFYERLKGKRDIELEEGNLPRSEVEAGLGELKLKLAKPQ
ncbi:MAG TPA: DUF6483 family protein [Verrucomicrobiae bacterium]